MELFCWERWGNLHLVDQNLQSYGRAAGRWSDCFQNSCRENMGKKCYPGNILAMVTRPDEPVFLKVQHKNEDLILCSVLFKPKFHLIYSYLLTYSHNFQFCCWLFAQTTINCFIFCIQYWDTQSACLFSNSAELHIHTTSSV